MGDLISLNFSLSSFLYNAILVLYTLEFHASFFSNQKYQVNTLSSIYIYKMGVQMFVCFSLGMWRVNGNPNPCTDLDEILHPYPHLSKEGFGTGLTHTPSQTGGHETLKAEGIILKTVYKTKGVLRVAN